VKLFTVFVAILLAVYLLVVSGVLNSTKVRETFRLPLPEVPERSLLLPDLVVTKPKELYIRNVGEKKTIRFSTTFINFGKGPLEIIGHTDKKSNMTYAAQYIGEESGPGLYQDVGSFVFHPEHDHWHLESYVYYQLLAFKDGQLLAETEKKSFCIFDEIKQTSDLENVPTSRFYSSNCDRQIQGMSVGWSDTYLARFEGQELDVTGIPDGRYIFRSIINPERSIMEDNYDNNTADTVIAITGNRLEVEE